MAIGTALGFSQPRRRSSLAVALAFLFGYSADQPAAAARRASRSRAVIPIALASDTLSIATMEIVDNVIMLAIPGAMDARPRRPPVLGQRSPFALVIAGVRRACPVNRWLIARGKGHAAVHETGIHGGPSPRVVGAIAAVAAVFGTTVLIAEAITARTMATAAATAPRPTPAAEHGGHAEAGAPPPVRGAGTDRRGRADAASSTAPSCRAASAASCASGSSVRGGAPVARLRGRARARACT